MKKVFLFLLISGFLIFPHQTFATSSYVLPYPSTMPGSIFYKIHVLEELVSKYWYYGDFGTFDYNRKLSDKYLVEAKTLLEYQQYLLGFKALQKSDDYFVKIQPSLDAAKIHGKNISEKQQLFTSQTEKHIELLQNMLQNTPAVFQWTPEKSAPTTLNIHTLINGALMIRKLSL